MATNPTDPATKRDLIELEDRLIGNMQAQEDRLIVNMDGKMQVLEDRLVEKMQQQEDRLVEKMRDMQTDVLRAFHDWAPTMETRTRIIPVLDERLTILEDRVSKLERGERPLH